MKKVLFALLIFAVAAILIVNLAQPVSANMALESGDSTEDALEQSVIVETGPMRAPETTPDYVVEEDAVALLIETISPYTACYVTGSDVREREAPVDGKIICEHQRGDIVEVEEMSGEWWRLSNGRYMFAEYLIPVAEAQYFFEQPTFYVSGNGVRERTGPGTDYDEVTKHSIGEPIEVLGERDGWYRLANGNYVCGDYVVQTREEAIQAMADYYGDFALISISEQYVEFYDNGTLLVRADCVTGHSTKSPTPTGVYQVQSRLTDFDMNGNPNNHVEYAIFFNGGIAIHDAAWRYGNFGGNIYVSNGSHGCVNTTLDAACIIYENTRTGTYVIVFP